MKPPALDAAGKAIQDRAAEWVALKAAGSMTLKEQADLADWLASDPLHAAHFDELAHAWAELDKLGAYPHSADAPANEDLLKPSHSARPISWLIPLAAAAVVTLTAIVWFKSAANPARVAVVAPAALPAAVSPIMHLSDGSTVEMNVGAEVLECFTPNERRVKLAQGEAHFQVTKNPSRPFIVEANGVSVRAVGTAFDVRINPKTVDVVVTEGTVQVTRPPSADASTAIAPEPVSVTVGQRTTVSLIAVAEAAELKVESVSLTEMDRLLSWQRSRFVFEDQPLEEIVARFNRQSAGRSDLPQLVINDPRIGGIRMSGRIRSDSLDNFVEVLESSFGVQAKREGDRLVLRMAGDR